MLMRMKIRYFKGMTKSGHYDHREKILPGSWKEAERHQLSLDWPGLTAEARIARTEMIYPDGKLTKCPTPPTLVNMRLHHGDIVVMNGHDMQKYYEASQVAHKSMLLLY
jgi:hypothetical protein